MQLIRQKDKTGCGIACLAMIEGLDYDTVKRELVNLYHGGLLTTELDHYLAKYGWAVRRLHKIDYIEDETRHGWPIVPGMELGLWMINVYTHGETSLTHTVILKDSWIYDPAQPEPMPLYRLQEYPKVNWVAELKR